jgi:tRNA-2-methylthio-N6-dimethylallyladenosine synthase
MSKQVFLQTYGCQMNERDSEEILGMLTAQGYRLVSREDEADVVLLNTCSVREHAEARAFGKMAIMQRLKREKPDLVLGILGCMAKAQREEIFRRLPQVDLVAGPAEIYDLPDLLARVAETRQRDALLATPDTPGAPAPSAAHVLAIDRAVRPLDRKPAGDFRHGRVTAFVTIMEGCDKRCAYCIVPMTRGQEVSRPIGEILEEVQQLARAGYRQVTLLGQNVNSYGKRFPDGSGYLGPGRRLRLLAAEAAHERGVDAAEEAADNGPRLIDFPALLRAIGAKTSIPRVRFTTSHPFDAHEELFRAMADGPSVCEYLHLPVQSGSNPVLKAMRRGYTVEAYEAKVAQLRELVPDVGLSTDIIVGFPGETEADFEATVEMIERVGYDNVFVFRYSRRPGTPAATMPEQVAEDVKADRNRRLLEVVERVTGARSARLAGRTMEVLVDGVSRRNPGELAGRTRCNRVVNFDGQGQVAAGDVVHVRVTAALPHSLRGTLATPEEAVCWSK